jgi:hypothetical protein
VAQILKPSTIKKYVAVICLDQMPQEIHNSIIESLKIQCGSVVMLSKLFDL